MPCFAVKRHEWFLVSPPCHDPELMLKTGAFGIDKGNIGNLIVQNWDVDSASRIHIMNPFVSLPCTATVTSQAVPRFWNLKAKKSKEQGLTHTRTHTHIHFEGWFLPAGDCFLNNPWDLGPNFGLQNRGCNPVPVGCNAQIATSNWFPPRVYLVFNCILAIIFVAFQLLNLYDAIPAPRLIYTKRCYLFNFQWA